MRSLLLTAILAASSASGENLLKDGSFEEPKVTGRALPEKSAWAAMAGDGAGLKAGLTDEIARTGKQSMFVDFEKVTAPGRKAVLMTELVAIKPAQDYRISIWGRVDRKRPLALDERRPHMWLEVEFFKPDGKTSLGEPIGGVQFIPGNIVPGGQHELLYVSGKWKESYAKLTAPEEAAFARVVWTWATPADEGETDGAIYWDDAAIEEEPPAAPASNPGPKTK